MPDLIPPFEPVWKKLDPQSKFEALKMRFEQQTELLRYMRQMDLTILTGFLTIQAVGAGRLLEHPLKWGAPLAGMAIFDVSLLGCVIFILYQHFARRNVEVEKLRAVREALGFYEKDVYLPGRAIEERRSSTLAANWYWGFVVAAALSTTALFVVALATTTR